MIDVGVLDGVCELDQARQTEQETETGMKGTRKPKNLEIKEVTEWATTKDEMKDDGG
jgi:hypothetical protein